MPSRPKRTILADANAASSPPASLPPNHVIARVLKGEGNSLFSVQTPSEEQLLVELPFKLRNVFWLKKGGYVVIDTEEFAERDNKLDGMIVTSVMDEKDWRKMKYWPKEFEKKNLYEEDSSEEESNMGKMPPSDSEEEDDEDEG